MTKDIRPDIKQAFETDLMTFEPLPTEFENDDFDVPNGPYRQVFFLWPRPENPTYGDGHYRQRGILQVSLHYPIGEGSGEADLSGGKYREHFARGLSLTGNGVTTIIDETPEVGSGSKQGDRYVVVVRVRFYADAF